MWSFVDKKGVLEYYGNGFPITSLHNVRTEIQKVDTAHLSAFTLNPIMCKKQRSMSIEELA